MTIFYQTLGAVAILLILFVLAVGLEMILNLLFRKKLISGPDGSPYMHRWYIFRTKPLALFVHKFVRSDYDSALHDHPFNFLVIPIWRGYIEHSERVCPQCHGTTYILNIAQYPIDCPTCKANRTMPVRRRIYPIISTRFRRAEFKHRVELLQREVSDHTVAICGPVETNLPAWSIFIRFRERRNWGFWCPSGWKPWQENKPDICDESLVNQNND